jgi:Tol biopolymer transport system component
MRSLLIAIAGIALAASVVGAGGDTTQDAERQLKVAMNTELVDGNLKLAIDQYKKVAESSNRALAAQALLRMADCYQKLGDREAQAIYERLVRDYGDQKAAAASALARLGTKGATAVAKGDRVAWSGPAVDMFGQVSPDGRYLTYVDWGGNMNLMLHDLVANTDRPLTATPAVRFSQFAEFSAISKDSKQVAYAWYNETGRYELRVLTINGTTASAPRTVMKSNDDIASIAPADWSSDGKWIAANVRRADGTGQIALVSVTDGALRVLKSVDWRGSNKIVFSPDDRYLAYDLAPGDSDTERHVYVMAIDGSRESAVVADKGRNVVMAWAPDGSRVLFASDRSGEMALWGQTVVNARSQGRPELLKSDIGSPVSLGITTTGSLYVYKAASANFVHVVPLDLSAAKVDALHAGTFQRFVGTGGDPSWSADGKSLIYKSCGPPPRAVCAINIASVETDGVRQGWPKISYLGGLRASADGRSFVAAGRDIKGRQGLYRIDAQSFDASPVVTPRPGAVENWSPDGKTLYFRRDGAVMARELATGVERVLFKSDTSRTVAMSIKVSPDGRYIASVSGATLYLIPTAGGATTEVVRASSGEAFDGYRAEWTPDSRSLLIAKTFDSQRPLELWLVPMFDRVAPRKVDVDTTAFVLAGGGLAIRPDGKQLAYVGTAGKQGATVWALENFLPVATTAKPTAKQ